LCGGLCRAERQEQRQRRRATGTSGMGPPSMATSIIGTPRSWAALLSPPEPE